jgi:uncharacterized membrane protein
MKLKKREIAAIITIILVILIVCSLLYINYLNYAQCKNADSTEKPGCYVSGEENQTTTSILSKIRIDFGSRYIDVG